MSDSDGELSMDGERQPLVGRPRGGKKSRYRPYWTCCWLCCFGWLFVASLLFAVAVGLCIHYGLVQSGAGSLVAEQVILVNGSAGTEQFTQSSASVYVNFTLFNITNPKEFMSGLPPNVEDVGPFVYREDKVKFDLVWNEEETVLRYNESCRYTFDEELNILNASTTYITTINIPLMGVISVLKQADKLLASLPDSVQSLLEQVLKDAESSFEDAFDEHLLITRTVDEILWGYQDNLLKFLADTGINGLPIPSDGTFSLEQQFGYTGPNMVWTGKNNIDLTASYIMYDGQTSISDWGTPYAGMLNGTEALLFPPGVDENDTIYAFVGELYRSGYFIFKEYKDLYGIKTLKFILPSEELDSSKQDPGFFPNAPSGVLNLTAVYPLNVPVFASKPLFLDADEIYRKNVTGMSPARAELHDSYLCVEPLTGGVLEARKRLQFNIHVEQNPEFKALVTVPPNSFVPVVWASEGGSMTGDLASDFKGQVYSVTGGFYWAAVAALIVAVILAVVSCVSFIALLCYCTRKSAKTARHVNEEEEEEQGL